MNLVLGSEESLQDRSRSGRALTSGVASGTGGARAFHHAVAQRLRPFALPALRVLLGLVFVWFGGLKIIDRSPVAGLVSRTLPFADKGLLLPTLGTAEVALGVLLMSGALVRLALPVLTIHLAGTFFTFVVAPDLMFSDGNPLLLTANGEFVAKNVVLIAATLVLIAHASKAREPVLVHVTPAHTLGLTSHWGTPCHRNLGPRRRTCDPGATFARGHPGCLRDRPSWLRSRLVRPVPDSTPSARFLQGCRRNLG